MASELFDFMWLHPLPAERHPNHVQHRQVNTLAPTEGIAAAIIYPALLTPAIVVGQDWIELLIAFDKKSLEGLKAKASDLEKALKVAINRQLKVHRGSLNVAKRGHAHPLFGGTDWADQIKVEHPSKLKLGTDYVSTAGWKDKDTRRSDGAFAGRLDERFIELLNKNKVVFDQLYKVSLASAPIVALQEAYGDAPPRNTRSAAGGWEVTPKEPGNFDYVINGAAALASPTMEGKGAYAYRIDNNDVRPGVVNWSNPLQAYHPVFAFKTLESANVGFVSDVHVNCRQQVLRRSPARVIEHDDFDRTPIGEILNIASGDTIDLLDKLGASDSDLVVIGGDLVDFMHNVVIAEPAIPLTPTAVWELVDVKTKKHYRDYVDCVAFFGIMTRFIDRFKKPLFAYTGNHDCYYEPYGISPRVSVGPVDLRRANEGIPWDHNLTIYEAILAFGPTYGTILTGVTNGGGRPPSSFWKEKLAWFYTAFTPFSDFVIRLPKQYLTALGWGTHEDMLSPSRYSGQGLGHLPRANTAISDAQLALLQKGATEKTEGRKIILVTHFNFVSYHTDITNLTARSATWGNSNDEGDVYYTSKWYSTRDFSIADMGTFHLNRERLYKELMFDQQKIQIVLTGHSHRRGFYTLRRVDESGNNSVKTGFYDYPTFAGGKPVNVTDYTGATYKLTKDDQKPPYIIVSDSGGPLPRLNLQGEFSGWGSDYPAATRVGFEPSGDLKSITAVPVSLLRAQPRFAVALDYMDIFVEKVIEDFSTAAFDADRELDPGFRYVFALKFTKTLSAYAVYGLTVASVSLYFSYSDMMFKIGLEGAGANHWAIPSSESLTFRLAATKSDARRIFLALTFTTQSHGLRNYNMESPWTFEVEIDTDVSWLFGTKKIEFARTKSNREIPDLDDRRSYPGY